MYPALLATLLAFPAEGTAPALARLEQALQEHVAEKLRALPEDVEILHLGISSLPPCASAGTIVLDSAASERFRGHATVMVDIYGESDACISIKIRPHLRTWVEVPVADGVIRPGEELQWVNARVPVEELAGSTMTVERLEQTTWLARTTLPSGTPLSETVLRPRPDASSGQEVIVLSGSRTLVIKTEGRLVADAFVGETVRVANLFSHVVHDGVLFAPSCVATATVTERMKEACPNVP